MPGICVPTYDGGIGFDYRLGMAIPDFWIKMLKDTPDEEWNIWEMWLVMTDRPPGIKTVAYAESHDQAPRRRQDHSLPPDGPSDVRLDGPHHAEHSHRPRNGTAQDDTSDDHLYRRRGIPQLHGQRVRPPRVDRTSRARATGGRTTMRAASGRCATATRCATRSSRTSTARCCAWCAVTASLPTVTRTTF